MAAARAGDSGFCVGVKNTILAGSPTVLIGGLPAARVGDAMVHGGTIIGPGYPAVMIGP